MQWTLAAPPSTGRRSGRGANGPPQETGCSRIGDAGDVAPGDYTVKLTVGGHEYTKVVQVLEDRWLEQR